MLSKKNRVDKKGVDLLFKEGKSVSSSYLTFKFLMTESSFSRVSVVAPKTVAKLATKRNLLRRLGYFSLGGHINEFPIGIMGVLIFKKYEEDPLVISNEIKTILGKLIK